MNLQQAVAELEGLYGPPSEESDGPDRTIISSGGVRKSTRDPEPALYLSADLAIESWLREMGKVLDRGRVDGAYRFIDGPHLDKWAMTVTDLHLQQRIAEMRYSVTATVGVQWVTVEKEAVA